MTLHKYFQHEANARHREAFEQAFLAWYARTRESIEAFHKNPDQLSWDVKQRCSELVKALETLKTSKTLKNPLEVIINIRSEISAKVAPIPAEHDEHYEGAVDEHTSNNNGAFYTYMNTNWRLNDLSIEDQAILYANFNLVAQLAEDDAKVVNLAKARKKTAKPASSRAPADQQPEAAASARLG